MANEKTYPNYLMHYRTKGSKNGVSRTKGYTAVGQKAKGRYINGRYVYDTDAKGAKNNWQQWANKAASGQPSGYNQTHYNAVSQAAAERKAREAVLGRQKKTSLRNAAAKGARNDWQQAANKTAGILGNMSREDRSLMKSHETRYHDKNGKLHINGGFNVNNKYGYSNYTKSDEGWRDIHVGEYNTTGVKGVKKQQDWNTSFERNHRSDIGNAIADAKEDAKKAFKEAKADAKQTYVNLKSKLKSKFKKKKK